MIPIVVSAFVSMVLGASFLRITRKTPLAYVGRRELVRVVSGAGIVASIATILTSAWLASWTDLERALVGIGVAAVPSALAARHRRLERAIGDLVAGLPRSLSPGRDRRLLLERLADLGASKLGASMRASLTIDALAALRRAGFRGDAQTLAAAVNPLELPPEVRERIDFEAAALALDQGEIEAAEAALAAAACASPALRALCHAVQGGADQALACLEEGDFRGESGLIAAAARAHALASMGEEAEADRSLGVLVSEYGIAGLAWVLRPVGPASERARALLVPSRASSEGSI